MFTKSRDYHRASDDILKCELTAATGMIMQKHAFLIRPRGMLGSKVSINRVPSIHDSSYYMRPAAIPCRFAAPKVARPRAEKSGDGPRSPRDRRYSPDAHGYPWRRRPEAQGIPRTSGATVRREPQGGLGIPDTSIPS